MVRYITLNFTLSNVPGNECMDSHESGFEYNGNRHLELLKRMIVWDTLAKEDKQRQVLLQWDQMLAFYRHCQKLDHCRDNKQMTWYTGRASSILHYVFCSTNAHHQITSINQLRLLLKSALPVHCLL